MIIFRTFFIWCFCLFFQTLIAQDIPYKSQAFSDKSDTLKNCSVDTLNEIFLPLKFWVYCGADVDKKLRYQNVKAMVNDLNYYNIMNKTGIKYYLADDITFLSSEKHRRMGYFIEAPLQTLLHKKKNCINIHLPEQIVKRKIFKKKISIRGTYNSVTKSLLIVNSTAKSALAHEIGHFLGLLHPFRHSNRGKRKQEAVDRNRMKNGIFRKRRNCEVNGDKLSDTPAEPILRGLIDENCNYTGTLKDNWGDAYRPNTNNIMSYQGDYTCRSAFTKGQIKKMWKTLEKKRFAKMITKYNINEVKFDYCEPNNFQYLASELIPNAPLLLNFCKFSNYNKADTTLDYDWLKFLALSKCENYFINIKTFTTGFPEINIQVYNEEGKEIPIEKESNKSLTEYIIKLSNLNDEWYYISISSLGNTVKAKLLEYQVTLNYIR